MGSDVEFLGSLLLFRVFRLFLEEVLDPVTFLEFLEENRNEEFFRNREEVRFPVVALRDPEEAEADSVDGRVCALVLLRRLAFSEVRREPEDLCITRIAAR